MADETPDPEVERMARLLAGIYSRSGWDNIMAAEQGVYRHDARMVLVDLRERYVLVPRDGVTTEREHWISDGDDSEDWWCVSMNPNLNPRRSFLHRYRTVWHGPWEATP